MSEPRADLLSFARTLSNADLRACIAANAGIDRVACQIARSVLKERSRG